MSLIRHFEPIEIEWLCRLNMEIGRLQWKNFRESMDLNLKMLIASVALPYSMILALHL